MGRTTPNKHNKCLASESWSTDTPEICGGCGRATRATHYGDLSWPTRLAPTPTTIWSARPVRTRRRGWAVTIGLSGLAGNDTFDGGEGKDTILGGDGDDFANVSTGGDDVYFGGNGNDFFFGFTGNETYHGDAGDDTLKGFSGNDTLDGGAGADTLDGGDGIDTVDYSASKQGIQALLGEGLGPSAMPTATATPASRTSPAPGSRTCSRATNSPTR